MNTPQGPQPYRHNQPPRRIAIHHRRRSLPRSTVLRRLRRSSTAAAATASTAQQYRGQPPPPPQQHFQPRSTANRRRPNNPGSSRTATARPVTASWSTPSSFRWRGCCSSSSRRSPSTARRCRSSGWGRTHLPARPGQHHVHVHVPYFLPPKLGPADATADVRPGQVAELEYKAPMWAFSAGSLGVGPQKYNGVGITIAIVAIPFVIVFLLILFFVVLAVI